MKFGKFCFMYLFSLGIAPFSYSASLTPDFQAQEIDNNAPGAYQTALVDINQDGKLDVATLGEGEKPFMVWYENPSWKRRPIAGEGITRAIDFAFGDIDGDGYPEAALASGFDLQNPTSGGQIHWLKRQKEEDKAWIAYPISAEPTAHRLRWLMEPNGQKRLIVAPLLGPGAKAPQYNQSPARLLAFTVPANPQSDPWPIECIDQTQHLVHGLFIDSENQIWTAGREGITRFFRKENQWEKRTVGVGAPESSGMPGSSEVAVGKLKEKIFVAAIEPWHGNQLAVYLYPKSGEPFPLDRKVIDDSYRAGHALACADFDGDGEDEIIAGFRGEGYTIYYYDLISDTQQWKRYAIDAGGVSVQGFAVGDINRDGKLDFVATGGTTHNVKIYWNKMK